jgi:hypothetical protein
MQKSIHYPANYPQIMSGKLTYKVKIKDDYMRSDGPCAVYIQVFLNEKLPKKIAMNFAVDPALFDKSKQRVKSSHPYYKDYNLLIEKKLADINTIEVNYRLANNALTLPVLIAELENPTARMDFIKFWGNEMINQKLILEPGTYRQQETMLNKTKEFKNPIFFYEIDQKLITELKIHCKKKLKNSDSTVATLIKSFKKFMHIANDSGIKTPIRWSEIKNKSFKGNRTYLLPEDIIKLHEYYESKFVKHSHKVVLARFLFYRDQDFR